MIFENSKLIFIHYPKTAGNSIQDALRKFTKDEFIFDDFRDGIERFEIKNFQYKNLHKHSTMLEYKQELGNSFSNYQFFIVIRNPFDRLVSSYFSPIRILQNPQLRTEKFSLNKFKQYVLKVSPLDKFITNKDKKIFEKISFMRYEHIDEDFTNLCRALNINKIPLPRRNTSIRPSYKKCYDDSLKEWVYLNHKLEISIGNYQF